MRYLVPPTVLLLSLVAGVIAPGFVLDPPLEDPPRSDAIVVISGDEQLARFREGIRLYQRQLGAYLVFSGAAHDGSANARALRHLAASAGVPESAILEEDRSVDTLGNAEFTLQLLEARGARSVILVTSPYHVQRARKTFEAAYAGSGIRISAHAAPDSVWRKLSWWQQPETRRLTLSELEKLAYITVTGRYR